jgi:hypothetical protein
LRENETAGRIAKKTRKTLEAKKMRDAGLCRGVKSDRQLSAANA